MLVSGNEWRRHDSEMEPQGGRRMSPFRVTERSTKLRCLRKTTRRSRVHVQTVGLNAETTKVSAPSRRGDISLDIRFYRTSPIEKPPLKFHFHGVVDSGGMQDGLGSDGGLRHRNGQSRTPRTQRISSGRELRGQITGRLLLSEGEKETLAEIAQRVAGELLFPQPHAHDQHLY